MVQSCNIRLGNDEPEVEVLYLLRVQSLQGHNVEHLDTQLLYRKEYVYIYIYHPRKWGGGGGILTHFPTHTPLRTVQEDFVCAAVSKDVEPPWMLVWRKFKCRVYIQLLCRNIY